MPRPHSRSTESNLWDLGRRCFPKAPGWFKWAPRLRTTAYSHSCRRDGCGVSGQLWPWHVLEVVWQILGQWGKWKKGFKCFKNACILTCTASVYFLQWCGNSSLGIRKSASSSHPCTSQKIVGSSCVWKELRKNQQCARLGSSFCCHCKYCFYNFWACRKQSWIALCVCVFF